MKVSAVAKQEDPSFLIVGTPRSGTTLLQRMVCELPGVAVPPETRFWPALAAPVLRRNELPLTEPQLRNVVEAYRRRVDQVLDLETEWILRALGRRCDSLIALFAAVVRCLVPDALISGEKTPRHLLWWRPLSRAVPHLKFISIIRDPRAVVASSRHVPFMPTWDALVAERWARDQAQIWAATEELGHQRLLAVRYEDLVTEPGRTQVSVAQFLGLDLTTGFDKNTPGRIFHPHEWWKERVHEPIAPERADAWRQELTQSDEARVSALCHAQMRHFGYEPSSGTAGRALRGARYEPRTLWRLARYRRHHRKRQEWIDGLVL